MDPRLAQIKDLLRDDSSSRAAGIITAVESWTCSWQDLLQSEGATVVEVSCSPSSLFDGSSDGRMLSELKLEEVLHLYRLILSGKTQEETGQRLRLYLAQCPIEVFPALLQYIPMDWSRSFEAPGCRFDAKGLCGANVWLSLDPDPVTTTWHYDANCNLLFVLYGSKTVRLMPPSYEVSQLLRPQHIGHPSANHARASLEEIEAGIRSGKGTPIEYQVNPGMVLYIPEGWWHSVTSTAGTAAVNLWYIGMRQQLCDSRMAPYYLRTTLEHVSKELWEQAAKDVDGSFEVSGLASRLEELLADGDPRSFWKFVDSLTDNQALVVSNRLNTADEPTIRKLFLKNPEGPRCKKLLLAKSVSAQKLVAKGVLEALGMLSHASS